MADYNDSRLTSVTSEREAQVSDVVNQYNEMITNTDNYYSNLKEEVANYEQQQTELQQARNNQTIAEINQEKAEAGTSYAKEQKGAYTDYLNASNIYGTNAESMASNGLSDSGLSESNLVSMYNTYQNRVTTAKESYEQIMQNYNNNITKAKLKNSELLAEIAYNALEEGLQLTLENFQYKNELITARIEAENSINSEYWDRYQDVLSQINYEDSFKYQQERDAVSDSQWEKEYDLALKEYQLAVQKQAQSSSSSSSSSSSKKVTTTGNDDDEEKLTDGDGGNNSTTTSSYSPEYIISKIQMIQGANVKNNIKDGISGKTFSSVEALMDYYGYVIDGSEWSLSQGDTSSLKKVK